MNLVINVVTVHVNCSARHQTDLSHEPCCNNRNTHLGLIRECCTCYLTLYVVTAAFEWTVLPEAVYVLLCYVFLAKLGLIPFNLELTFTFLPPLKSWSLSYSFLDSLHQSHPCY